MLKLKPPHPQTSLSLRLCLDYREIGRHRRRQAADLILANVDVWDGVGLGKSFPARPQPVAWPSDAPLRIGCWGDFRQVRN